jgi:acyl-coenzyme A synthetase/AMP-(fatty) acid ligase
MRDHGIRVQGVAHTTAGYLLHAAMTHKLIFDYKDGDIYCCPMDCGWITGHTCESVSKSLKPLFRL